MKKYQWLLSSALLLAMISCYEISDKKGFLSNAIKLKGGDTTYVFLGSKGKTDMAWLDGSSKPVNFTLENVRDSDGKRSSQFFETYTYRAWLKPYNNKTDTTLTLINNKLNEVKIPAFGIVPATGQLYCLETTNVFKELGSVFKADVKVSNSGGEQILKDYATIKLVSGGRDFVLKNIVAGIFLVNSSGVTSITLYDNITDDKLERINNIYARNGKELPDIYKISDEPKVGVKVLIKYLDSEGVVFAAKDYATYATGTESYLDYAVNRKNTEEGVWVEFPVTPWPTRDDLLSYLKGGSYGMNLLDTAAMRKELYVQKKYPVLAPWPDKNWWGTDPKWFIRLRSSINFNKSGTYVIACKFPYVHLDGTF
ncbi:MAG: hypothetical protein CRN43_11760 [Candidatus Nephrothrix sp. EaCA]|nr:MAG: hypothetical protein CRN43_11760 [Candidatus Nephrothrix sp. EaCA]